MCEKDESCLSVLRSHNPKPDHAFADVTSFLSGDAVDTITRMQEDAKSQGQETNGAQLAGSEFLKAAFTFLRATCKQERKALRSWCHIHQGWCYPAPWQRLQDYEENGVRAIWMEISGNSCTPWPAAGRQTGWLHPASVAGSGIGLLSIFVSSMPGCE